MAKRLINKSRIKRLASFPWEPGVETKDLPKANYAELHEAVETSRIVRDHKDVKWQQEMLLARMAEAHDEPGPRAGSLVKEYEYMAEPEWLDAVYPGISRDEQAMRVELSDDTVFACLWIEDDECFLIFAAVLKKFPFETMFISKNKEDDEAYAALQDANPL